MRAQWRVQQDALAAAGAAASHGELAARAARGASAPWADESAASLASSSVCCVSLATRVNGGSATGMPSSIGGSCHVDSLVLRLCQYGLSCSFARLSKTPLE